MVSFFKVVVYSCFECLKDECVSFPASYRTKISSRFVYSNFMLEKRKPKKRSLEEEVSKTLLSPSSSLRKKKKRKNLKTPR
jgi:hypothetical protein